MSEYKKPKKIDRGEEPDSYKVGTHRELITESKPVRSVPDCGGKKKRNGKLLLG